MTTAQSDIAAADTKVARPRRYAMTAPTYFNVEYSINPWMDLDVPVDRALAVAQWQRLHDIYVSLGHTVELVNPIPGLLDMVFAANGALVVDGQAIAARFTHPQRSAESEYYSVWLADHGFDVYSATHTHEGEGDFLVVGDRVLAGAGFRTDPQAHIEIAEQTGWPVVALELVDPRFYHLDTALAVLSDTDIAYYPAAFSAVSQMLLKELYPDAIVATEADALVLGLNAVSDGRHVVLSQDAVALISELHDRGYEPIGVDLSELLKGGGSVKCCTMELRERP